MRIASALPASRAALISALGRASPQVKLNDKGYSDNLLHNLVAGVSLADFESDLRQGDGNELEGKFLAAHSSSALAVNNFAPFRTKAHDLTLPGGGAFDNLCFERKCPHGLAGRKPPNLDVLASSLNDVAAIESKCLEYLTPHSASFAPAYEREIQDRRRQTGWFTEMQRLNADARRYRWLDAAQLIKHAFGLAYSFPNQRVRLFYLFWEPANAGDYPVFAEHREEITRFAAAIGQDKIEFQFLSYPELWLWWRTNNPPDWLSAHLERIQARYGVTI